MKDDRSERRSQNIVSIQQHLAMILSVCTGESAELPPRGGQLFWLSLDLRGGQVKSFSRLLLILSKGGAIILAKLRFLGGGKQSLGESVRQIPL